MERAGRVTWPAKAARAAIERCGSNRDTMERAGRAAWPAKPRELATELPIRRTTRRRDNGLQGLVGRSVVRMALRWSEILSMSTISGTGAAREDGCFS